MQPYVEGVFVDVLLGLLNVGPCPEAETPARGSCEDRAKAGRTAEGREILGATQVGRGRKVSAGALEGLQLCCALILDLRRATGKRFLLSQSSGCDHLLQWPWTLTWLLLTEHALAGASQL